MTKKQLAQTLRGHKAQEQAKLATERIERKIVAGYPYSHNPYIAHEPAEDCFPGCVLREPRK